jgi:molybdate transport system substrate-binding protein
LAALIAAAACAMSCAGAGPDATARPPGPVATVRIAAASDLRYALDEVVTVLKREQPALDLQVAYGSSGTFFAQLVNGAPVDLFMSADVEYPRQLAARGLTVPGSEFTYAIGRLAVWVPAGSPLDVAAAGMAALVDPRVAHVAIANPAHAPYGRAAEAAMRQAAVYERVRPKIVLGENVSQAMQFVQSGAAQVGIVALSLAVAPAVGSTGKFWTVPAELHPTMEQGGVILRSVADEEAARAVRAFLLGGAGRSILTKYGFFLPET